MRFPIFGLITASLLHVNLCAQESGLSSGNPVAYRLNYGKGEKNAYSYTENGCRIIGRLFSPNQAQPKKKEKHPMADMPVLKEHRVRQGKHTTVFKKIDRPKKARTQNEPAPLASQTDPDPTQVVPAGADATKPAVSFSLNAEVYSNDLTILTWQHEGQRLKAAVNRNLLPLATFSAFESPNYTYLFFYLPKDLREDEDAQLNRPDVPAWNKGRGIQYVLLEGNPGYPEATDGIDALLEIFRTHRKDLKQVYKAYKKHQKEMAAQPRPQVSEPTTSEIFYYRSK